VDALPPIQFGPVSIALSSTADRTSVENVLRGVSSASITVTASITLGDAAQVSGTFTFGRTLPSVTILTNIPANIAALSTSLPAAFNSLAQIPLDYLTSITSLS